MRPFLRFLAVAIAIALPTSALANDRSLCTISSTSPTATTSNCTGAIKAGIHVAVQCTTGAAWVNTVSASTDAITTAPPPPSAPARSSRRLAAGATNGFCYAATGDHWESSASYALSAVGSPTTVARRVCPNGPDCGLMTGLKLNGSTQGLHTSAVATPSADFTHCTLYRVNVAASQMVAAQGGSATSKGWRMFVTSINGLAVEVNKDDSTQTVTTGLSAITTNAIHFSCMTYHFATSGTSRLTGYNDGAQVTQSTTAVGPVQAVSKIVTAGEQDDSGFFANGQILVDLHIDGTELNSTQITTLTAALLPQATGAKGTRGESITTTRASVATCTAPGDGDGDGANDVRPPEQPALHHLSRRGVRRLHGAERNELLVQSEAIDNASWSKDVGVTVTANQTQAPTGATTADLVRLGPR
jgi:hypothetical protein